MPDIKRSEQGTQFSPASSHWLLTVTDTGQFPLCSVPGHFWESPSDPRVSRPQRLRWMEEVQQRWHQTVSEETFRSRRGRETLPGALRTKATHGLWLSNRSSSFYFYQTSPKAGKSERLKRIVLLFLRHSVTNQNLECLQLRCCREERERNGGKHEPVSKEMIGTYGMYVRM